MDAKRIRKNTTGLLMPLVLAFCLMPHVAKAQINPYNWQNEKYKFSKRKV